MPTGYTDEAVCDGDHCDPCAVLRDPCHRCGKAIVPLPRRAVLLIRPTDDQRDAAAYGLGFMLSGLTLTLDSPTLSDGGYARRRKLYPNAFYMGCYPYENRHDPVPNVRPS